MQGNLSTPLHVQKYALIQAQKDMIIKSTEFKEKIKISLTKEIRKHLYISLLI